MSEARDPRGELARLRRSPARIAGLLLGLTIGVLLCWKVATENDLGLLWRDLLELPGWAVLMGAGSVFSAMACRTAKWRIMLQAAHRARREARVPPWGTSYSAVMVGTAVNLISPLRLDEIMRTWFFSWEEKLDARLVFGTVVVDKVLDIGFLAMGMGIGFQYAVISIPSWAALAVSSAGVGLFLGPALVAYLPALVDVPLSWLPARAVTAVKPLVTGLKSFPRGLPGVAVLLWTAAEWFLMMGVFYAVLWGLGHSLPMGLVFSLIVVTGVSFMMPTTPGAVGTLEFMLGTALHEFAGLEAQAGTTAAAGVHALQLVPAAMLAAVILAWRWFGRRKADQGARV